MKFIAAKTDGGRDTGKIAFYCRTLGVSRQGFYRHLAGRGRPWKHQELADAMREIAAEDECNDTYGRIRMRQALVLKGIDAPSESTVYRVMRRIGLTKKRRRKPNGLTKEDREAMKSDDLLGRDFEAEAPLKKSVTDITQLKGKDGKLYISAMFDCFDAAVLGLAMDTNMKAELCEATLEGAALRHPGIRGAIVHSDRGAQYTSAVYREAVERHGIRQSMNSAGGRCHDNAQCESMWARMKEELFYSRGRAPEEMTVEELRTLVWRYFMGYWNNRRVCSANEGLPPMVKRQRYYESLKTAA